MVVGIGVCDTTAARRYTLKAAFVERLERHEKGARSRHLLHVNQLLSTAVLASCNVVLHVGDHHRDNGPGLRCARDLGNHSDLHDLRFDLSKAGKQNTPTSIRGDQDASRSHHGIDHIASPQHKLLHAPVYAGTDNGLS